MDQTYFEFGLIFTIIILAIMLGVFLIFSNTIMPGLKKVSDSVFVKAFSSIDRAIINPLFMLQFFGPAFLLAFLCWFAFSHKLDSAPFLLASLLCYIVVMA